MYSNRKDLELVGYDDITELSKDCKFSNCAHVHEADCAVKKAIADGNISEERFHSYYRDKKEAEYVSVQKNKTKAVDYMKQRQLFRKP
ncbi:hypothetical protein [Rossellomorea sp. NRS-1567]|uniref:hypothetical protein n=1 Tax=Rossellomorea sp. NRS-1567 TaxID=3233901 RepID=UPI003D29C952